ncbi:hypothetical protein M8J76_015788 [Diaphorina citri]|nr:hypothetical protein M8J75_008884 [Diaphorina citri]KAI5750468.1 hypothetical protein M8J76_015788 [Diaphorina citri]KAI5756557.1 hypothetical protein M8J77_025916 [Diaphorina citri]
MALSEPILDYPAHHSTGGASINERRGSRTGGSMFLAPYCQLAPRRRHSWIGGHQNRELCNCVSEETPSLAYFHSIGK